MSKIIPPQSITMNAILFLETELNGSRKCLLSVLITKIIEECCKGIYMIYLTLGTNYLTYNFKITSNSLEQHLQLKIPLSYSPTTKKAWPYPWPLCILPLSGVALPCAHNAVPGAVTWPPTLVLADRLLPPASLLHTFHDLFGHAFTTPGRTFKSLCLPPGKKAESAKFS